MTSEQILKSDMLDILFDGRNKAYGAYELRKKEQGVGAPQGTWRPPRAD